MKSWTLAACAAFMMLLAGNAHAVDDVMVVFDGSNSMWGQIDGTAKIEIARDAMQSLMGDWTAETNLGLMAYGHRRRGDCGDIETVIPPGRVDRSEFLRQVGQITPRGKTPLSDAIEMAADQLAFRDNPATVVVISDGIESCGRNPCALADELERAGIGFTAHVIGFGLGSAEEAASLACIAERTGGRFIAAGDASELKEALGEVSTAVASAPEPEPQPAAPAVEVMAPESVTAGAEFEVSWNPTLNERDIVTVVPADAEADEVENHLRTGGEGTGSLRAPGEPGLYEVRYVRNEARTVAGRRAVEITEGEVSVTAPETALAGSAIEVAWNGAIDGRDIITIVPAGSDEDEVENHLRVRDKASDALRVPGEPGLYEVRYVLDEGRRVLASRKIELTEGEVSVTAPETALAGSAIEVAWNGAIDGRDIITIVPAGSDEDEVENHLRVRDKASDALRVPGQTGLYEVRYVLDEGRRVLASRKIELTEGEVSVTAPETALAGSAIEVAWNGAIDGRDIITIVLAGSDEDEVENHLRVRDKASDALRVPGQTGLYEVRYVLDEGRRVLASGTIELVEPSIRLTATETARAGDEIDVRWTGDIPHRSDIVTIVPVGTEEDEIMEHVRVREKGEARLRAPEETGLYEVRYLLDEGRRILARASVEVVAATAALDTGGSLDVPETAAPGANVQVGWTSSAKSERQRIALARSDQADFTWIEAKAADNEPPLTFTMPQEAGRYEFRLLDLSAQKVLSRAIIEVR